MLIDFTFCKRRHYILFSFERTPYSTLYRLYESIAVSISALPFIFPERKRKSLTVGETLLEFICSIIRRNAEASSNDEERTIKVVRTWEFFNELIPNAGSFASFFG